MDPPTASSTEPSLKLVRTPELHFGQYPAAGAGSAAPRMMRNGHSTPAPATTPAGPLVNYLSGKGQSLRNRLVWRLSNPIEAVGGSFCTDNIIAMNAGE